MATLDTNVNMVPAGEGSSCSGPSNTTPQSSKKFKRFEIKKWNAVSIWADTAVEECAHCRCHIMDLSERERNAQLLGGFATMPSTSTASAGGLKDTMFAFIVTANGEFQKCGHDEAIRKLFSSPNVKEKANG